MRRRILVLAAVFAFLWPACAQAAIVYEVIDLGTLGGDESLAYCINDAGQIVGEAMNNKGDSHATLFDPTGAGNNLDLGTLGGRDSWAWSINDVGQIVGYQYSSAISINNAGQIVGEAEDTEGNYRATLFDPTGAGNNIDLNILIDPASGWMLISASDINNSGWIVGQGINPQGESHAFLLVPCRYKLAGDLNDDCKVDFADFALMAANWLVDCREDPTNPACVPK